MKLHPCGNRLVVKRLEGASTTKSGLYIPESAKEKPKMGTVLKVGGSQPADYTEGDTVVFGAYVGEEVHVDGDTFVLLSKKDVLAVLKNDRFTISYTPEYDSEEHREAVMLQIAKRNAESWAKANK